VSGGQERARWRKGSAGGFLLVDDDRETGFKHFALSGRRKATSLSLELVTPSVELRTLPRVKIEDVTARCESGAMRF
jgi:hypothetical protein